MGKISRMLEKSGYALDQHEQGGAADIEREPILSPPAAKSLDSEEIYAEEKHAPERIEKVQENPLPAPVDDKPLPTTEGWDERLTKVTRFSDEIAEAFRVLRAKILLPQDGRQVPRSIMVTSALPSEGKSFVSANLGIALAQGVDQHSLLVDCDLRFPTLAELFGVSSEHGLADYLQADVELSDLIQKTSERKLSILASGHPPRNPAELLGSARMHDLVEELGLRYPDRFVVFDSPPLQVASESIVLAQAVDGVILVVRHGVSSRSLIEKIIDDIGKEKIIGVIFNGHIRNPISSRLVDKNHYYGNYYKKRAK